MRHKAAPPNGQLIAATYLVTLFLFWRDIKWESSIVIAWAALSGTVFLAIVGIIAIVRLFRRKSFQVLLIPVLVYFVYCFRLLEGRRIYAYHDCDMGVCADMELRETGTWRFRRRILDDEHRSFGTFDVKHDTVYLYSDFSHLSLYSRTRLITVMRNRGVRFWYGDDKVRERSWPLW